MSYVKCLNMWVLPSDDAFFVVYMRKNELDHGVGYVTYWSLSEWMVELGRSWFATKRATPSRFPSFNYNNALKPKQIFLYCLQLFLIGIVLL